MWKDLQEDANKMLAHETRRMKLDAATVAARIADGKMWYMKADEALAVGAVDAVTPSMDAVLKDPGYLRSH